jgi:hypothetical protein
MRPCASRAPVACSRPNAISRYDHQLVHKVDREMGKANETKGLASSAQLWRLNQCGLIDVRDAPAEPLTRGEAKECLAECVHRQLWVPVRGPRQDVRSA